MANLIYFCKTQDAIILKENPLIQLDKLKECYGKIKISQMGNILPGRTLLSIVWQAKKMGLKSNHSMLRRKYNVNHNLWETIYKSACFFKPILFFIIFQQVRCQVSMFGKANRLRYSIYNIFYKLCLDCIFC
jgi:hypothetical protein